MLLTSPIGQGGMGTVWHAQHPEGVEVAVKVLRKKYASDERLLQAFRFEARSVASLDHPAIVRVYDYGVVGEAAEQASEGRLPAGSPWLAMEYATAGTFADLSAVQHWSLVRDTILHLLDGLAHSHARGIIHRDLKPQNVLLRNGGPAALTDFGIAHAVERFSPSSAGAGTPGYMPPEQVNSSLRDMGPWTDLYALGCLTWRLFTGRPPYVGESRAAVLRSQLYGPIPPLTLEIPVPDGLEAWLRRMLANDPDERYLCAADAAHDLRGLEEGHEGLPPIPSTWRAPYEATITRPVGTGLALFVLRPWPIVGREHEQDQLWAELRRVASTGTPGVLILEGDPGIGKTRLMSWLAERAHEAGAAAVWAVRHDKRGRGGLVEAARSTLRTRDLDPAATHERLTRWLSLRGSEEPEEQAMRVASLLMATDGTTVTPPAHLVTPAQRTQGWLEFVARLAHQRPLVLTLDDLHWGGEALGLAAAIAESELPVLVVATLQRDLLSPEQGAQIEQLEALGAGILPIQPLEDADMHRLLEAGGGLSPGLTEELLTRASGNPSFAVGAVVDWARQGVLVPTSHGFDLREGSTPRTPSTIREHFTSRMAPLESSRPAAIQALEILAALGARIREGDWRATCEEAGVPLEDADLEALGELGLATADRPEDGHTRWDLGHPLLRDVLLEQADTEGRLASHHRNAGKALLLMRRFSAQERGLRHLVEAGEIPAALASFDTLLEDCHRRMRPERMLALLDFEERLIDAGHAPRAASRRIRAMADRAAALLAQSDQTADSLARVALAQATATQDKVLMARAGLVQLRAWFADGTLEPKDPLLKEVEGWVRQLDDALSLEELQELKSRSARAQVTPVPMAERQQGPTGPHRDDARQLLGLGEQLARSGRPEEAEPWLVKARQAFQGTGNAMAAAEVTSLLAAVARFRGDLVASRQRAQDARERFHALKAHAWSADLQMGLTHLARGELAQAKREFASVAYAAQGVPHIALVATGGLLCCAAGQGDEWDEVARAWRDLEARVQDVEVDSAWPLEWAARRAAEAGDQVRARDAYGLAAARYQQLGDEQSLARVHKRVDAL